MFSGECLIQQLVLQSKLRTRLTIIKGEIVASCTHIL